MTIIYDNLKKKYNHAHFFSFKKLYCESDPDISQIINKELKYKKADIEAGQAKGKRGKGVAQGQQTASTLPQPGGRWQTSNI